MSAATRSKTTEERWQHIKINLENESDDEPENLFFEDQTGETQEAAAPPPAESAPQSTAPQVPEISIDAHIFQQAHALAFETLRVGNFVRIVNSQGYLGRKLWEVLAMADDEGMYQVSGKPHDSQRTKRVAKENIDIPFLIVNIANYAALTRMQEHLRNEKVNMRKVHE